MFKRQQMEQLILLLLLCLGTSVAEQELPRQAEHNRVVLELPTFNFTRLYNDINLSRLYSRLFNSTKEQDQEQKQEQQTQQTIPAEELQLRQALVQQTLGSPILPNGYQYAYTPQPINGLYNPNLLPTTPETQRSGSPTLSDLVGRQFSGLSGFPGFGFGFPGGNGFPYSGYSHILGSNNLNNIPGLTVQELPYSALIGTGRPYNYYNYINSQHGHGPGPGYGYGYGYHRPGYGGGGYNQYYGNMAPYHQFLQSLYGRRGLAGAQAADGLAYGQEGVNSFGLDESDDYLNGEVDDYADDNEDVVEFGEGDGVGDDFEDDIEDGDDLWRKVNAVTKTKQNKVNKRLKKRKQQHQQQSIQRAKRISY